LGPHLGPLLTGHTNIVLNTPTYPIVGYLEGIKGVLGDPLGTPKIGLFWGQKGPFWGSPEGPFWTPFGPLLTGHTNIVLNTPTYPIVGYLEGIMGVLGDPSNTPKIGPF